MPIEAPSHTAIGSRAINSEFVICQNFVFRPANVDGFSHQTFEDGSAVTTVNFKSYTQGIPDPERRLFDFLTSKLKPKSTDESLDSRIYLLCIAGALAGYFLLASPFSWAAIDICAEAFNLPSQCPNVR